MVAAPIHILAVVPVEPKPATVGNGPVDVTPIAASKGYRYPANDISHSGQTISAGFTYTAKHRMRFGSE
jgi:hypothetical protein